MDSIKPFLTRDKPVKWLFCGDSITHGVVHTNGYRSYVELFAERVQWELPRYGDLIINTAIGGNSTPRLLTELDWRITQFQADVVFLMIGMNDCETTRNLSVDEFTTNLHTIAEHVTNDGAELVLQTTCPVLPGGAPTREPRLPDFMDAVRHVAAARNCPLIDHTVWWQDEHAESLYFWMNNPFHPNEYGHRAIAHYLFQQLDIFDSASSTCRLFVP